MVLRELGYRVGCSGRDARREAEQLAVYERACMAAPERHMRASRQRAQPGVGDAAARPTVRRCSARVWASAWGSGIMWARNR